MRFRPRPRKPLEPPRGVRLVSPAGDVIECDAVLDPGLSSRRQAVWVAVPRKEFLICSAGWSVDVDFMPPNSAIGFSLPVSRGEEER